MRATFANIYLDNIRHNISEIRRLIPSGTMICVPVKADAYGHGAVPVARVAVECGAEYLAVATVAEGAALRSAGIAVPVLVLSLPHPSELAEVVEQGLVPAVQDEEFIRLLGSEAEARRRTISVHLKVDTGMGRIGCVPGEAVRLADMVASSRWLSLGGMFTHLPVPDSASPDDEAFTAGQLSLFGDVVSAVRAAGISPGICHAASSAAVLRYPEASLDMVRPGLAVYGYYPGDVDASFLDGIRRPVLLKPAMELRTTVVAVRRVRKGQSVSYGRTWIAPEDCDIGVLPLGYADGLLRHYGGHVKVTINGRAFPLCGRICMDQCMVCLGNGSGVSRWDEAVVFGPRELGSAQDASGIACAAGTIPYEITCGVNRRVPRVYKNP